MKHSHLSTPRTLADCEFRTGYHGISPAERSARRVDVAIAVVGTLAVVLMLIGVI